MESGQHLRTENRFLYIGINQFVQAAAPARSMPSSLRAIAQNSNSCRGLVVSGLPLETKLLAQGKEGEADGDAK